MKMGYSPAAIPIGDPVCILTSILLAVSEARNDIKGYQPDRETSEVVFAVWADNPRAANGTTRRSDGLTTLGAPTKRKETTFSAESRKRLRKDAVPGLVSRAHYILTYSQEKAN